MPIKGYTIAIYGSASEIMNEGSSGAEMGEPIITDKFSCVDLSKLNTTDPMTDTKWLKLDIIGWEIKNVPINENQERVGGIHCHLGSQYREHTIKLTALIFPDDWWIKEKLEAILRKPDIYLYKGDYECINAEDDTKSFRPHPDNKCLKVAGGISEDYKYENGEMELVLNLKNVLPYLVDRTV